MTLSTTSCKFGDVVLVGFPFTNLQAVKKRPAVVINSSAYSAQRKDLIVLAITSQVQHSLELGEQLIGEWQQAGLLKASAFKPLIATLEQGTVLRRLGRLAERDLAGLKLLLQEVLGEDQR